MAREKLVPDENLVTKADLQAGLEATQEMLLERIERMETTLLQEFRKWAISFRSRFRASRPVTAAERQKAPFSRMWLQVLMTTGSFGATGLGSQSSTPSSRSFNSRDSNFCSVSLRRTRNSS